MISQNPGQGFQDNRDPLPLVRGAATYIKEYLAQPPMIIFVYPALVVCPILANTTSIFCKWIRITGSISGLCGSLWLPSAARASQLAWSPAPSAPRKLGS
jgi:hypothetical protein